MDTKDKAVDPTFDLDLNIKLDTDHIAETFCEEWVSKLDRVGCMGCPNSVALDKTP